MHSKKPLPDVHAGVHAGLDLAAIATQVYFCAQRSQCELIYDGLLPAQGEKSTSHLDGITYVEGYELWDLPGRRLRRWPRGDVSLGVTWPVLEQPRWPWDD
jgi:hypothetical protein